MAGIMARRRGARAAPVGPRTARDKSAVGDRGVGRDPAEGGTCVWAVGELSARRGTRLGGVEDEHVAAAGGDALGADAVDAGDELLGEDLPRLARGRSSPRS